MVWWAGFGVVAWAAQRGENWLGRNGLRDVAGLGSVGSMCRSFSWGWLWLGWVVWMWLGSTGRVVQVLWLCWVGCTCWVECIGWCVLDEPVVCVACFLGLVGWGAVLGGFGGACVGSAGVLQSSPASASGLLQPAWRALASPEGWAQQRCD